jgi:hypothetical protein
MKQITTQAGEDSRKGGHVLTAGGSANLYSHCENQCGDTSGSWESIYLKIQLDHSFTYIQRTPYPTIETFAQLGRKSRNIVLLKERIGKMTPSDMLLLYL